MDTYLSKNDGLEMLYENYQDPKEFSRQEKIRLQKELDAKLYDLQCSAPVEDIDDLVWKYEEYNVYVENNTLYASKPVNMRRFMTLRRDASKCGIDNIVIEVL
jgi:hypothetical protein